VSADEAGGCENFFWDSFGDQKWHNWANGRSWQKIGELGFLKDLRVFYLLIKLEI